MASAAVAPRLEVRLPRNIASLKPRWLAAALKTGKKLEHFAIVAAYSEGSSALT
jgi:hypothetical protein